MDFPGNSNAARIVVEKTPEGETEKETSDEPKKVEKVVAGRAIKRKKPLGTRVKDMFINDGGNFGGYLVEKVIVPRMKDMVLSIITQTADGFAQGLEEKMFGSEGRARRTRPTNYGSGRQPVNYTRYSNPPSTTMRRDNYTRPPGTGYVRRSNMVQDIIVETRDDGDIILTQMDTMIDRYGHATVGDFYGFAGERPVPTDEEWGWISLAGARVEKLNSEEFRIVMPRPHPIESS
jgi:hypothetical protein